MLSLPGYESVRSITTGVDGHTRHAVPRGWVRNALARAG
jgi:hypothetical protein